jgi:putative transposase
MRLAGYDYALEGGYFVTLFAQKCLRLFGEVDGSVVRPSEAGHMLAYWWGELPRKFTSGALDEFVVMPNHLHGVVLILEAHAGDERVSLPRIMQWFNTMTTNAYIRGVKHNSWSAFPEKLWQRGYSITSSVTRRIWNAYEDTSPAIRSIGPRMMRTQGRSGRSTSRPDRSKSHPDRPTCRLDPSPPRRDDLR